MINCKILLTCQPKFFSKTFEGNEEGYFTAIMLKKSRVKFKSQEIIPFPDTKMMRNLLCVHVSNFFKLTVSLKKEWAVFYSLWRCLF